MKIGEVIGSVVSTQKLKCFDGMKLLLVRQLDKKLKPMGIPFTAVDVVRAGEGDIVYYECGKEAGFALNGQSPCDATIIAIIDEINIERDDQ